jgi:hypothetical protein
VVDIGLTVIASKPRFTNPPEMFSAGFGTERCCITAFIGFWELRWKVKCESGWLKNPPFLS